MFEPATTSALISAGSRLLGGLLGGKKSSGDPATNTTLGIMGQAQGARRWGEEYGFNPLTLLGASSAQGGGYQAPPLASGDLIANSVSEILHAATGTNDRIEEKREQAELDRLKKENEILNAGGAGPIRTTTTTTINKSGVQTPQAKEETYLDVYMADPGGFTEMRAFDGSRIKVRNDVLYRLDLPPGALYGMAEDAEMAFGEIGGEITGVGNVGDDFGGESIVQRIDRRIEVPEPAKNPTVKYPSLTGFPAHQNPTDVENIRKNRYPQ